MRAAKRDEREATREALRATGLRVTASRLAVLSALRAADTPLSHADVAKMVEHLGLDRTTVYRNLLDLTEVGLLRRSDVGHTFRFELVASREDSHETEGHPHFVCTDCGKVTCLPLGAIAVKAVRGAPAALRRGNLEIQVRGQCDACA
jgi:Fur family ferric uptake transcriptional regulator